MALMKRIELMPEKLAGAKAWLQDDLIRRAVKNVGYLVSGSAAAAALQFITLILTARTLGPAALGILALLEAHVRLIDGLVRLEPWQAVIRYGADNLEKGKPQAFRALLKFGVLVDIGGAIAATLIALSLAPLIGYLSSWSEETIQLACLYSLVLLTRLSATWTGVLRLFDRFRLIAIQQTLSSGLRLILTFFAFLAGADLEAFLVIAAISSVFSHAIVVIAGWQTLLGHDHGGFLKAPLEGVTRQHPKIWSFMWALNASALIRRVTREADTLIVGGVLGPAAAGLFHVAKKLGDALIVLTTPIQQAIYPDIARLWARREVERFRKMVVRLNWLTGIGITMIIPIVAFNIDWVLSNTFGDEFVNGAMLVIMQLTAAVTTLYGIANRAALQSMGKHAELLWVVLLATATFFSFFLALILPLGVISASLGHLAFNLVWLVGTTILVRRGLQDAANYESTVPETGLTARVSDVVQQQPIR